jgi:acyl-CoA reductase-like NAD-dependent aldehyde dehydrogenase
MLTFTGSSSVGWGLRERAPKKKVSLELGNATPVIVDETADLDDVTSRVATHGYSFAGQSCISIQRVYVQRAVYDEFLAKLTPKVEALSLGDPADEETDVGPVIDEDARKRIVEWIEEARSRGARMLTGGGLEGELIQPTLIADAPPDVKVSCEEVFGPVVIVNPYDELDDAIRMANATRYGLQAGIFTQRIDSALRAARELEFGGVTVNEAPTFRADQMPYGGVKDSGNTREGPPYAVREMTEERLVIVQL